MTELYVSTACLPLQASLEAHIAVFRNAGMKHIEIGSFPKTYEEEVSSLLRRFHGEVLLHNYYVSTSDNLVLNLASPSAEHQEQSLSYMKRAIEFSSELGARWYSFHGGFIADPIARDSYGFVFPDSKKGDYGEAYERFCKKIEELSSYALQKNVTLLVENNVCASQHRGKLLFVEPSEFTQFFSDISHLSNVGMLLDTGHLKVSASSLQFAVSEVLALAPSIVGVHLHDNDGSADQHLPPAREVRELCGKVAPQYITLEAHYKEISELQRDIEELSLQF